MARKNDSIAEIDKEIGKKIKALRLGAGLSRERLATKIDVTFQQLAKYENGANRLSVGRLMLIAKALSKDLSYFYRDYINEQRPIVTEAQRTCTELARNFMKIKCSDRQHAINNLIKALAKAA